MSLITSTTPNFYDGLLGEPEEVAEHQGPRIITQPMDPWDEDGKSYEDYEKETLDLVEGMYDESRDHFGPKKLKWQRADKLVELEHILDDMLSRHPEKTRYPFLLPAMEEWLATRYSEEVRGSIAPRQVGMEQIAGAGNYFLEQEFDANSWNVLRLRVGLDQLKCRIGFYSVTVDRYAKGIFGQEGEHRIDRVDPRYVWPDRYADSWAWRDMKYLIIARPMDLSDIQRMWPDKGHNVKPDTRLSYYGKDDSEKLPGSGNLRVKPSRNDSDVQAGKRERALVLECYLRDQRMRCVPAAYDEYRQPRRNSDGSFMLEYVPRYPNGRLIVIANKVLLRDTANPWNHGEHPLVPSPASVYDGLFSFSPLEVLDLVDRKRNLLIKEAYENIRVHCSNPWLVDRNAFTKQSQYDEITQKRDLVLITRPNARVARLPPGELPQQLFSFFEFLGDTFDHVLGVTKIDRGQLEKGSQMSAQSVVELQGASGERKQVDKKLDMEAAKGVTHKTFSNIRQFYPAKMELQINDPTGKPMTLTWDNTQIKNPWDFKVEAGNASGAEASAHQRAVTLYDKGILDGEEVLKVLNWPKAQDVLNRMRDERTRLAQLGFIKEALKKGLVSTAMSQTGPKKSVA